MIEGLNGRLYKDGKRVEVVPHPELRSKEELRAARAARQPRQPTGRPSPDFNPYLKTIEVELKRHNHIWAQSAEGKRVLGNLQRASDEWEAKRRTERENAEFAASIEPLVSHATTQYELVISDPTASVEDCERAADALSAAKQGRRDDYVAWERARQDQVTSRLAEEAASYDAQARAATEKRNAVLRSGLEKPDPVPEVKPVERVQFNPKVDQSHVALTKRVRTENGYRDVTEIVPSDDPRLTQ